MRDVSAAQLDTCHETSDAHVVSSSDLIMFTTSKHSFVGDDEI